MEENKKPLDPKELERRIRDVDDYAKANPNCMEFNAPCPNAGSEEPPKCNYSGRCYYKSEQTTCTLPEDRLANPIELIDDNPLPL